MYINWYFTVQPKTLADSSFSNSLIIPSGLICALNGYKRKYLKTRSSYFYDNLNQGSSKQLQIVIILGLEV